MASNNPQKTQDQKEPIDEKLRQEAEDFALEDVEFVEFIIEDWMDINFVDECTLCLNFFYNKDFEEPNCHACVTGMEAFIRHMRSGIK
jgi:hypothetical protein